MVAICQAQPANDPATFHSLGLDPNFSQPIFAIFFCLVTAERSPAYELPLVAGHSTQPGLIVRRFRARFLVLVNNAFLHDEEDFLHDANVLEGIAGYRDDIRRLAGGYRSGDLSFAKVQRR